MSVRTGKPTLVPDPHVEWPSELFDSLHRAAQLGPANYIVVGGRTLREIELARKKKLKK